MTLALVSTLPTKNETMALLHTNMQLKESYLNMRLHLASRVSTLPTKNETMAPLHVATLQLIKAHFVVPVIRTT